MIINIGLPDSGTIIAPPLAAHTARDIESFMPCQLDDCTCCDFSTSVPAAACLVVDQTIVTRSLPDGRGKVDAVAIDEAGDQPMRRTPL